MPKSDHVTCVALGVTLVAFSLHQMPVCFIESRPGAAGQLRLKNQRIWSHPALQIKTSSMKQRPHVQHVSYSTQGMPKNIMQPDGSFPYSRRPAIGPYLDPVKFNTHVPSYVLEMYFTANLASTP
jgi:hypothetical protein